MPKFGLLGMFLDQAYPPAPKFTEADVPDLSGKVVVVTGGNTGIGKETARVVLEHGAKVYVACRSEEKANTAIKQLKELTGKNELHFISLNSSSFASIRRASEELRSKEKKLDILFNNAAVMSPPIEQITEDGYDMTFGTNVVGPFLFTKLLPPLLKVAAFENGDARIINTSSLGHAAAPKEYINWDTLKPVEQGGIADKKRRAFGPDNLYYQSKCGVIMMANEWARRYGDQGITSCALHPGTVESELGRHWPAFQRKMMGIFIKLKPTSMGAITQLYAGTSPNGKELNGKYLIPWARVGKPREDILDEKQSGRLWNWLEEQTRVGSLGLGITRAN